jgi:hypothetical protein
MRRAVVARCCSNRRREYLCGRNLLSGNQTRVCNLRSPVAQAQFHQAWHDIENADRAQQCAGRETRRVRVVPNTEVTQREIYRQGCGRDEEPFASGRFRLPQRSYHRVKNCCRCKPAVQTGAARADSELMSGNEEGAFRNLMANVAERSVDRKTPKWMSCLEGQRSADDERHERERYGDDEKPYQQRAPQRKALGNISLWRAVHRKSLCFHHLSSVCGRRSAVVCRLS